MLFKRKLIVAISLVILTTLSTVVAQEKMVLTLEKSLDIAFEKNPELQKAEKKVAKARASVWEAYSIILPQLNGNASFQHAWNIQTSTIPNFLKIMLMPQPGILPPNLEDVFSQYAGSMPDFVSLSFGLENTFMYGATLTQPLYLGGAGIAGVKIAGAAQRATEQGYESQKQNLIYQTANAFYACLVTEEIAKVQQEALGQAEENLDLVTKKYNVGSASGFDKMRAQVKVANLKPPLISARNNRKATLTALKTVLGLDRKTEIMVQGAFKYVQDDLDSKSLEDFQQMALGRRPEVNALEEHKYIAQKGITLARSSFMPKVFFQTDYSFLAMRPNEPLSQLSQNDFSKGFTSAISLSIPLFNGFKNKKNYQKAKIDYNIMLDTSKQLTDGISAEVEIAFNGFSEAKEKYEAASQSVDLAQEALRLANMMYNEGANMQLDVLNSQLALTQARLNYVSSIYEYQMARYSLQKATGMLKGVL
jgi:outer membrane protein